MTSRQEKAIALFKPDINGESQWVSVEDFEPGGLKWTSNGNLRRGAPWSLDQYIWEVDRGPGRRVITLRMAGLNNGVTFNQSIPKNVRSEMKAYKYCNISLLPVPSEDREIDHRFGNKNHPDYVAMYSGEIQPVTAYQLIHRVLNLQKRQMCRVCVETGCRPAHPTLGYAEGDATIPVKFPCTGCFLAEPERFRGIAKA